MDTAKERLDRDNASTNKPPGCQSHHHPQYAVGWNLDGAHRLDRRRESQIEVQSQQSLRDLRVEKSEMRVAENMLDLLPHRVSRLVFVHHAMYLTPSLFGELDAAIS